jgi:hypothetical protein
MSEYNIEMGFREVEWDVTDWIDLNRDSCEDGNELPGSLKCREITEQLSNGWLLEKRSVPWSELKSGIESGVTKQYTTR